NVHRYGYVHGALTLSNILVLRSTNFDNDPDFAPFLLADVGMAQFVRRFGHPKISRFLITDAPEQARGRVTAASDQYALAVLLYFWLAGQPPFFGSSEEIEHAKRASTIPRLATQNPHITFEQEGIIQRALSGYPDDRYPTILTFAEALQASLTRANQTSATLDSARSSYPIKTEPLNLFLPTATPEATLPTETIPEVTEDGAETSKGNRRETVERISATFVLDQQELARLTAIAKQEPHLMLEPQANPPEPSAKPLDKLSSVPLELPTSGDVESDSGVSLSHRSVGGYCKSVPVPTSPPTTPPLSVLIQKTDEEGITPVKTEPLSTETDHTDPPSPIFIITSPYTENAQEFRLQCQETTIGRAGSSDILLEQDTLASRHHALLKYEDQRYVMYDCRSANGVILNGQKLTPEVGHPLTDGDHIQIGKYHLTFRDMTSQKQSHASKEHAI
ncbi:MAG TPA: FHA domain-containing protein, partial [Ktedonobacteraceae bacterium]|nr:FHA domain-containing protein [Ktedonobacteraceae bacterium]